MLARVASTEPKAHRFGGGRPFSKHSYGSTP
jgi:hypothetical protein